MLTDKTSYFSKNNPIGIFDSGVGGLTVVKEVMTLLPKENIVYFGDTARVPYGSKSKEIITKYSIQIMNFMMTQKVKSVIIACGTVSSNSYNQLKNTFDLHIIEVVEPGVNLCLATPNLKSVGVIGTEMTISSKAHETFIKQKNKEVKVYSKACPLFVPLAEEGWTNNQVARLTVKTYLSELIEQNIDALILGCTHYPLLKECIQKEVGTTIVINPAEAAAKNMKQYLLENDLLNDNENPQHNFFVSDNTEKFNKICEMVLGKKYKAEMVNVSKD